MATVHGNIISMGPAGDRWHYHRQERIYDLTRDASRDGQLPDDALTVRTTAGPPDTEIALAPRRTALVVVDMQNFFLHPRCRDHPTGLAAVAPTRQTVAHCRRAGVQVIWLNWGLTDDDLAAMPAAVLGGCARRMMLAPVATDGSPSPPPPPPSGLGVDLGEGRGRMLCKGAWNSAVFEGLAEVDGLADAVRPDLGDVLCDKTRMSGLWSPTTALRRVLDGRPQLRTLLFAGVNTDQCVLGTLTDAYNTGWDCVAVEDCCATSTPNGQATTMMNVGNNYGFVIDSSAFADGVLASRTAGRQEDNGTK